jgi:hypothetical protein
MSVKADLGLIVCTFANLHPFECGGVEENCPHCLGVVTADHDPEKCILCHWNDEEFLARVEAEIP